jgi:hypothetical protein
VLTVREPCYRRGSPKQASLAGHRVPMLSIRSIESRQAGCMQRWPACHGRDPAPADFGSFTLDPTQFSAPSPDTPPGLLLVVGLLLAADRQPILLRLDRTAEWFGRGCAPARFPEGLLESHGQVPQVLKMTPTKILNPRKRATTPRLLPGGATRAALPSPPHAKRAQTY